MKKRVIILITILGISFWGLGSLLSVVADNPTETLSENSPVQGIFPLPEPEGIYLNRRTDGMENAFNQAVFGPKSCTSYGDPYSPLNSVWEPGFFTYKYRILIPPNYPSDIVRVELFDPDSVNNSIMSTTFNFSQIAVDMGYPITSTAVCPEDQRHPCVVETEETNMLSTHPELSYDQINPFWMIRIDENRGAGLEDGDGRCKAPYEYTPRYNTQTKYELFYNAPDQNHVVETILLASYTGQTGDGVRDNNDHDTDMRWVSPGAEPSFDQPVFVPVDTGSPKTFTIDLTQDVPGIIVNPLTGHRELYLEVTAVNGASENGFDVWAGPPDYIDSTPSEVNARNLHIINNPQSHSSNGITVFALETLPQNSNIKTRLELPLIYLDPQYAGQIITMTAFDIDNTSPSPIVVYMDTIAPSDWSLTFGVSGSIDPDGVPADDRCLPGKCNNLWIDPAYQIQLPEFSDDCDPSNPDPQKCTPFYGGRLMVSFTSGKHDTYAWESQQPEKPLFDNTKSCTAFPIALNEDAISVAAPGSGSNEYPAEIEFDYPTTPPSYNSFISHIPNVPLAQAKEGSIFRFYDGNETGDFNWLRWNMGRPDNDVVLRDSISWPGNSSDYKDHGYTEDVPPTPLFPWIVDGYVNSNNDIDISLSENDWILGKSSSITSTIVQGMLNEHIDKVRTLRLIIWDESNSDSYRMKKVGIFRLVGYHIDATKGASWLALEFVRLDTSCGQTLADLQSVSLSGPTQGYVNTHHTFLATVSPISATLPISYTWEADGQPDTIHENIFQDEITFSWSDLGTKFITVTAQNSGRNPTQSTYSIDIDPWPTYLPFLIRQE